MFEIETGLIFWNTLSFLILVFLMYKWALPPLLQFLKEREKVIAEALSSAAEARKKAEEILASSREELAEANQAAQNMISRAQIEGGKLKEEKALAARREAELILTRAREDLRQEKEAVLSEIRGQTADLVILAASQILKKQIDAAENEKIINETIKACKL